MEITKYRNMFLGKTVELEIKAKFLVQVVDDMGEMTWEEKEKKSAFLYDLIKDCKTAEEAVKVFIENKLIDEKEIMNVKGDCDGTIS